MNFNGKIAIYENLDGDVWWAEKLATNVNGNFIATFGRMYTNYRKEASDRVANTYSGFTYNYKDSIL